MSTNTPVISGGRIANEPGEPSSLRPTPVRVLAVDDDPAACKLVALMLPAPVFYCTTASSGAAALARLQAGPFDAVISDLQMPGMGGLELLAQVRSVFPHIAFLVTTGVDDVEVGVRAMRCGADDYLVKPLHESAVLASIENALYKKRLEREVESYRLHLEEMVSERTHEVQAALQHIEHTYEHTLQALGAAIGLRDHETAGHSQRVCLFSLEIARTMGWTSEQLRNLAQGAYLHDIGKLGVPDGILLKPGPLDAQERHRMQQHVQIGFDIIKDIPFLSDAAGIVLTHHERYDGKGYPRGLRGEEIPVSSRIFSVADTLDAITSDRPYRRASSFEDARTRICELAGTQFDLEIVKVFLGIAENTWPTIAKRQSSSHEG